MPPTLRVVSRDPKSAFAVRKLEAGEAGPLATACSLTASQTPAPTNNPISRSHTPPRCGFFGLADATSGTVGFDGFGRGEAEDEAANEVARGDAVSSMTGVELRRVIVESQTPVGAAERGDSLRHGVTLFFQTGARLDLSPSAFPWEVRLQLHVYKTLPRKSALGYRCTGRLSHWLP